MGFIFLTLKVHILYLEVYILLNQVYIDIKY